MEKIYIAAPLFSQAEKDFNLKVAKAISPYFDVYLPQRDAGLITDMIREGGHIDEIGHHVFRQDLAAIDQADILLILLDGSTVDEGAAFELGYAYAKSKRCIGLKTDTRQAYPTGNHPMIQYSLNQIFQSLRDLISWCKSRDSRK
jgi:nucleoside 2-deoxyribosyltransferase